MKKVAFGQNLKYFREQSGFTQSDLAKKVGLSQIFISQLEHEHKHCNLPTAARIADVLNVSLDELVWSNGA